MILYGERNEQRSVCKGTGIYLLLKRLLDNNETHSVRQKGDFHQKAKLYNNKNNHTLNLHYFLRWI